MEVETRSDDTPTHGDLVQQRNKNIENQHQYGHAANDDEPVESYDAFDICIEGCKLFSHLYEKLCGLIGEFGVELVEFLIRVFHCVVFLRSFQGAVKTKVITGHNNCGKDTPIRGDIKKLVARMGGKPPILATRKTKSLGVRVGGGG